MTAPRPVEMHKLTVPVTVSIPEVMRPFDDAFIARCFRKAVTPPPASRLLTVAITGKEKASESADFVIHGELTFGRWFAFRRAAP